VRIMMTAGVALATLALALAGCATQPRLTHEGVLPALGDQVVLAQEDAASPAGPDAVLADGIQAEVMTRLRKQGAVAPGGRPPRYLVQVGVGAAQPPVGVSTAAVPPVAGPGWRSAPTPVRPWSRRGPVRTATLVLVDTASGKVVAWATVRTARADAADLAERLLAALSPPPAKG